MLRLSACLTASLVPTWCWRPASARPAGSAMESSASMPLQVGSAFCQCWTWPLWPSKYYRSSSFCKGLFYSGYILNIVVLFYKLKSSSARTSESATELSASIPPQVLYVHEVLTQFILLFCLRRKQKTKLRPKNIIAHGVCPYPVL